MGFDIRQAEMLYFVLASSPTLGEAFARVSRYSAVANESITLSTFPRMGPCSVSEIQACQGTRTGIRWNSG